MPKAKKGISSVMDEKRRAVVSELAALFGVFESSTNRAIREGCTNMVLLRMSALVNDGAPLKEMSDAQLLEWIDSITKIRRHVQGITPQSDALDRGVAELLAEQKKKKQP